MSTRRQLIHGLVGGMALFALLGSSPGARADEMDVRRSVDDHRRHPDEDDRLSELTGGQQ